MRRRRFLTLAATAALVPGFAARAEQAGKIWRIGQVALGTDPTAPIATALERHLAQLGYEQGKTITLNSRLVIPTPPAVEDAIRSLLPNIDLLVVWSTIGAVAAKRLASNIPVVFLSVGAPVDIGLVQSLAHPGGNMTGVTFEAASETYAKRLQFLKEIIPSLKRVAVLRAHGDVNGTFALASMEKPAAEFGVSLIPVDVETSEGMEAAFARMRDAQAGALIVVAGALTYDNSKEIAALALRYRLPSCHGFKETVAGGGLISLGPDVIMMAAQAAIYIDKIIHGASPADLPVEQPTRYEVYVNLKTAEALGLTMPETVLAIADEVIE
ncbi:ABC transporter substrate-binding protein [Bradyrhizobium sp. Tv2a-2]|uniref:ABC transporter substrate-binding protein n=1 Tax=Bradyrhizobium sp. Tv2a-2 TaxID=113395 RepID=UPI000408221D|nr:ABC transporter substrate-binding protein [Bradyrhizobium sp. Tv2a-2]